MSPTRPERLCTPALLLAGAALLFAGSPPVRAAEWTAPPGINVAAQERAVTREVTRAARNLVGRENLVDVIVHIGYVRTEREEATGGERRRVKLPGFSSYITSSRAGEPEIVSEFTRVRQVFVLVDQRFAGDPEAVRRELVRQGGFRPEHGDLVRVIPVKVPRDQKEKAGEQPAEAGPEKEAQEGEPAEDEDKAPPMPARQPEKRVDPLQEAQSTVHLMKARKRYFAGNFEGALDEILQAVTIDQDNAQAYAMLGSLYYAMNWRSLAIKYWERSLQLDPGNRELEELVTQLRLGQQ